MEKEAVLLRKIIACVLIITSIVVLFTACTGDKNEDGTTVDPLYTAYMPSASTSVQSGDQSTSSSTQANAATGATYILTTNQSKTAPWYSTTRFTPAAIVSTTKATVTTNNYNNVTYTTNSAMLSTTVSANVSNAASTTWKQVTTTTSPNTSRVTAATTTTTKPTTTKQEPQGVDVIINDIYISDGKVCASIDSEGWGSKIKSTSKRIPIYIDGLEADSPALMQISSSTNGDGFQYIYVDLTDFDVLDYGGTVSFTIPEGVLNNSTGTRYNYSFDVEAAL